MFAAGTFAAAFMTGLAGFARGAGALTGLAGQRLRLSLAQAFLAK